MFECNDVDSSFVNDYQVCDGNDDCPNQADELVAIDGITYQGLRFVQ